MPPSLQGLRRRLAALGPVFVEAFLRDNKVLPPVVALLALLVLAWIVAGTLLGGPDEERVSNQANVVQSQEDPGVDPVAPEVENRDVDSYAAYRNKDPFRQLLAPAESTSGEPAGDDTQPPDGGGGGGGGQDSDNDGLTDSREAELALDPQNPDTDGDGTLDGADDADGDGQPDGTATGAGDDTGDASASPGASPGAGNGGTGTGGSGAGGSGPGGDPADASAPPAGDDDASGGGEGGDDGDRPRDRPRHRDDLLDSGGSLLAP